MYTGKYFIEKLGMKEHPEGGWYKEYLKSDVVLEDGRKLWSSTYFLFKDRDVSHLHRLQSDEIWYYHSGAPLIVYIIHPNGELERIKMGLDIERGEQPQILLPKGTVFGATMDGTGYTLMSCMVSPGFKFEEFELFEREDLLKEYPQHELVIKRLTK